MNPESIKLITEYLDKVAAQIGVTGHQVWPWLIRQQYINFLCSIFVFTALSFLAALIVICYLKYWDVVKKKDLEIHLAMTSFIIIAMLIFSGVDLMIYGKAIFNPEYYALKDLFKMIKP